MEFVNNEEEVWQKFAGERLAELVHSLKKFVESVSFEV